MCYSQLSMLNELLTEEKIEKLRGYFYSLNDNTKNKITTIKIMNELDIDSKTAKKVLMSCKRNGILKISYAIRCPECGFILKILQDMPIDYDEFNYCYGCDEDINVTSDNVELIFTLVNEPGCFMKGQRLESKKSFKCVDNSDNVAPVTTLSSFIETGDFNVNEELYSPSEGEYNTMKEMYSKVREVKTTKDKGDSFEKLICYMMNLVKCFKADEFKTSTNQLDCVVRNTWCTSFGTLEFIGGRFIIECKNEKNKPKGTYMSKLHSIITVTNGQTKNIRFGIIASMKNPPFTFKALAVKYYLINGIIIISIDENDLEQIIINKENLLELIDRKCNEIIFDSQKDLEELSLY